MKPFILCLLACAVCACHSRPHSLRAPLFAYHNERLQQYDQYIAGLDSTHATAIPLAAQKFKVLFKGQPAKVCDTAYFIFDRLAIAVTGALNAQMDSDKTMNYEVLVLENVDRHKPILSDKLKKYQQTLKENGFMVKSTEGTPYVDFNREFISRYFYSYVSPLMKNYLVQLNKEQKEGFQEDAGLEITAEQLAGRAVWWERFSANSNFIYAATARENADLYRNVLVTGMDNTPLKEGDSLDAYYQKAYDCLQQQYPKAHATHVTQAYLTALRHNDTAQMGHIAGGSY